ncbi:MAG: efflux RND transporter periplasmic adaptor subunit [Nitrospirae bacterium]|nr:efflux RND transporter periplasmic adaptor subunit [Nitrospirota bacterium]NTW65358.1 efflux RND transporter periplasmic adaptor subunit [Nitrospirota bacterium]
MRNEPQKELRSAECGVRNEIRVRYAAAVLLLCIAAIISLGACSKAKQPPPRIVPVVAETAAQKNVPLQIKAIGNVEAYNTVAVKSQVNGEISEVFFREGQDVKQGKMLFRIDPRPFEAALRQAESALARDRAQALNAQEDAKRYSALSGKGYVSIQEYDKARTNANALDAVVQADEAAVENARLQLEYTAIMSPIDGRTGAISVQKGNVVKANDVVLVTINQVTPIYVTFSVPEQELANIKKYQATGELHVEVSIPQSNSKPINGSLTFIDNKVNTTTGTILLKATFPNQDRALWPGQFVDVVLTLTTEKDRVIVPSQAVQTGQQGQYVYVIKDDMTAELRVVTPGRLYGIWTVIDKGITAGEKVVTDGQLRLVPGTKVEIKNEKAKQDSATETQSTQSTAQTRTGEKK